MQYSGSVGLGLSPIAFEYHAGYSETKVLASFNIYDFKFTEALAFCNCILLGII
jgi:hypothetical protein